MIELIALTTALPQENKVINSVERAYPLHRYYYYTDYKGNAVQPKLEDKKPVKLKPKTIYQETTCLVPKTLSLKVYFDFNKFDLKPQFKKELNKELSKLKDKIKVIYISAYTDKVGSQVANQYIALMRAITVKNFLSKYSRNIYFKEVQGKCCYVSDKDELNRRAEIKIVYEEKSKCKEPMTLGGLGK